MCFVYEGQYLLMEGEPEATLLLQLRELKALYRQRYEALRSIKAEVNYCQHLVDQCRVRLLSGQLCKCCFPDRAYRFHSLHMFAVKVTQIINTPRVFPRI